MISNQKKLLARIWQNFQRFLNIDLREWFSWFWGFESFDSKTVQRSALCRRSRRELSNEYLLAKCGFDKAESEPDLIFCQHLEFFSILPYVSHPEYLGKYVCDAPKSVSDGYRRFVGNCWFVMNRRGIVGAAGETAG